MMSKADIKAYRMELIHEMRAFHDARIFSMNERRYFDMEQESRKFDLVAARIDTIDKILNH